MVKNFFSDLVLVTVLMFFVHCNNDPEPVGGSSFSNGVFIVNEGNFSDSDGSLSFYDIDSSKVSNKVFEAINDRPLAAVFQSMSFYDGYGFLIDQSGRIEIGLFCLCLYSLFSSVGLPASAPHKLQKVTGI